MTEKTHTKLHAQLSAFWGLELAFSSLNLLLLLRYLAKDQTRSQDHRAGPVQIFLVRFLHDREAKDNKCKMNMMSTFLEFRGNIDTHRKL